MFKKTLKSFFKSLMYIVVPMAFIYFGALSLILLVIEGGIVSISSFTNVLKVVVGEMSTTVSLNVNDFLSKFKTDQITFENLSQFFNTFIDSLKLSSQEKIDTLTQAGQQSILTFLTFLIIGIVIFVISSLVGSALTGVVIRRVNGIKVPFYKSLLRGIFRTLMIAGLIFISYLVAKLTPWLIVLIFVLYSILDTVLSFLFAYWLHRGKKGERLTLKETVRIRDVLIYYLASLLLYLIAIVIAIIFFFIIQDVFIIVILVVPYVVFVGKFFQNYAEIYVIGRIRTLRGLDEIKPKKEKAPKATKVEKE